MCPSKTKRFQTHVYNHIIIFKASARTYAYGATANNYNLICTGLWPAKLLENMA